MTLGNNQKLSNQEIEFVFILNPTDGVRFLCILSIDRDRVRERRFRAGDRDLLRFFFSSEGLFSDFVFDFSLRKNRNFIINFILFYNINILDHLPLNKTFYVTSKYYYLILRVSDFNVLILYAK